MSSRPSAPWRTAVSCCSGPTIHSTRGRKSVHENLISIRRKVLGSSGFTFITVDPRGESPQRDLETHAAQHRESLGVCRRHGGRLDRSLHAVYLPRAMNLR
jgi:hypothetical protein